MGSNYEITLSGFTCFINNVEDEERELWIEQKKI